MGLILSLSLAKVAIHVLFNDGYGIFRDELYYLACARHLDWGYVDHPPMVAVILYITQSIASAFLPVLQAIRPGVTEDFVNSLHVIRLPAALAGGAVVCLTGLIARELGGRAFAITLACVMAIIAPNFLGIHNFYSMNAFDHFFWALSVLLIVRLMKQPSTGLWIALGVAMGLGLQNKISMLFFGFGFLVGMLLTPARRHLATRGPWLCGGIALLIFLPHAVWQIAHSFPTLEFMRNASEKKNMPLSPLEFFAGQMIEMHPLTLPFWLAGLVYLLAARDAKPFRLLGWIYIAVFIVLVSNNAKTYYLSPIYPMLFAAGAVWTEKGIARLGWRGAKTAIILVLIAGGAATAPMALPVLPVDAFIRYQDWLGLRPPQGERHELGPLPQHYADMHGWRAMAKAVGEAYNRLPPEDRETCVILMTNYGQAGAVDLFGPEYGLPPAVCPHNSYYFWGPGEKSGEVLLSLYSIEALRQGYGEITVMGFADHPLAMPYERMRPIYLCRKPKVVFADVWSRLKNYN